MHKNKLDWIHNCHVPALALFSKLAYWEQSERQLCGAYDNTYFEDVDTYMVIACVAKRSHPCKSFVEGFTSIAYQLKYFTYVEGLSIHVSCFYPLWEI